MIAALVALTLAADPATPGPPVDPEGGASASATDAAAARGAPLHFAMTLAPREAPPCVGPLVPGAPPCRLAGVLGTTALITAIDLAMPVERRLIPLGAALQGAPRTGPGTPPAGTTWLTGFSSSTTFTGIGEFDMRQPPDGRR